MKTARLKVYILCNFNYMTSGKGKFIEARKRSVVARSSEEREQEKQLSTGDFQVGEIIFYDTIMVDTQTYAFVQNYRTLQHTVNLKLGKLKKNSGGQGAQDKMQYLKKKKSNCFTNE